MTFDYRAQWSPVPPRRLIVLGVAGLVLLVGCALWLVIPLASDAGRSTATGTIVSYTVELAPVPGTTAQFRPTIAYAVNGEDFTLTASQTVTAPDRRQLPVGSETVVRYDPADPASADWQPGGTVVAVNTLGVAGLITGFALVAFALVLWRRRREHPTVPEQGVR